MEDDKEAYDCVPKEEKVENSLVECCAPEETKGRFFSDSEYLLCIFVVKWFALIKLLFLSPRLREY